MGLLRFSIFWVFALAGALACDGCSSSSKNNAALDGGTSGGGRTTFDGSSAQRADSTSDNPLPVGTLIGICPDTGWCWQRPRPQGNDLNDIWVAGEDNVWAVGYSGTIIQWDGKSWTSRAISGVYENFKAVWAGSSEAWVAGDDVYHWKGGTWKREPGDFAASDIFATGPSDVWMSTENPGLVYHYTGQAWSTVKLPSSTDTCGSVWASGPKDVWLNCDQVLHYDGTSFTAHDVKSERLVGTSPTDVWASGYGGSVFHWDGQSWKTMRQAVDYPTRSETIEGIWPRSSGDVWIVNGLGSLQQYDGTIWRKVTEDGVFFHNFLMGVGPKTLWTGGGSGFLLRGDGQSFTPMTDIKPGTLTSDGFADDQYLIKSIWAFGANDAWAVTTDGILRKDGSEWVTFPGTSGDRYEYVWGSSPRDVWFVKRGGSLKHWDGTTLSDAPSPLPVYDPIAIAGSSPNNVWIVDSNAFYRWDGSHWTSIPYTSSTSYPGMAAWTSGPNDFWAAGVVGKIWHWDGSTTTVKSMAVGSLRSIWGTATDDVWVAGDDGYVGHWDGQAWTVNAPQKPVGAAEFNLQSISGTSKTNVWTLAGGGRTFHWNGKTWSAFDAHIFGVYTSISTTPDGGAFLTGCGQAILYHGPP